MINHLFLLNVVCVIMSDDNVLHRITSLSKTRAPFTCPTQLVGML